MSFSSGDQATLAASYHEEYTPHDFIDRQVVSIPDSNNGSYSNNQVVYDCTTLASSINFQDWQNAYISMPLSLTLTATGATVFEPDYENSFALNLKGSDLTIVNSMSITVNGSEVVASQPLSQIPIHYDMLTGLGPSDFKSLGPNINLYKTDADSLVRDAAMGEMTNGLTGGVIGTTTAPKVVNKGRYQQLRNQVVATKAGVTANGYQDLATLATANQSFVEVSANDPNKELRFNLMANIPCKYLHPMFAALKLVRGAIVRITLNLHTRATFAITSSATGAYSAPIVTTPHGFMPLQLSQASAEAGTGLHVAGAGGLRAKVTVGNLLQANSALRVPMITMSPEAEAKYVADPVRKISYEDWTVNASLQKVEPGKSVSQFQVSPGAAKLRRLLIVPMVHSDSNGSDGISAMQSAWSNAGAGTCAPHAFLTSYNVHVSGKNLYQNSLSYRFEHWLQEQYGQGAVNGGQTPGMITTNITRDDYNSLYSYVCVNLQRHAESEDAVQKAVQVSFVNSSKVSLEFLFYLFSERWFNIDVNTGAIIV